MSNEDAYFDAKLNRHLEETYPEPKTIACEKEIILATQGEKGKEIPVLKMVIRGEWSQKEPHAETFDLILCGNVLRVNWKDLENKFCHAMFDFANANITEEDFEE